MKRILLSAALAAFMMPGLFAQVLNVGSLEKVTLPQGVKAEQAKLSPDGTKIVLTDMAGRLKVVDRTAGSVVTVSNNGSMMDLQFNDDGSSFIYREATTGSDQLRRVAVKSYTIPSGRNIQLAAPSRNLQAMMMEGNVATIVDNGRTVAAAAAGTRAGAPAAATAAAVPSIDHGRLYLTVAGTRTLFSPLGTEGMSYLWPSVSPDGSKVLFFAAGYGTYTCNIDGSGLTNLGYIYAPVWYDNETIVGMRTRDNGRVTYEGAIVAASADGSAFQTLTQPTLIAVLPDAAPGRISFTTTDGEMYIINVSR